MKKWEKTSKNPCDVLHAGVNFPPYYWSDFYENFFPNSWKIFALTYVGRSRNFNPCWMVFRKMHGKLTLKKPNFLFFHAMAECHGHPWKIEIPHEKGSSFTLTMALVLSKSLKLKFYWFFRVHRSNSQCKKLQEAIENQRG